VVAIGTIPERSSQITKGSGNIIWYGLPYVDGIAWATKYSSVLLLVSCNCLAVPLNATTINNGNSRVAIMST
jgi:hypothetical protein